MMRTRSDYYAGCDSGVEWLGSVLLRRWMRRHDATSKDVARKVGVSSSAVRMWMVGKSRPRRHLALKVRDLAGVPLDAWAEPH